MHRKILVILAVLGLVSLACSISVPEKQQVSQGPTVTLAVNEPLLEGRQTGSLVLRTGFGKLLLNGGASGWVEGEIKYNVADWKPVISRDGGSLAIRQDFKSTRSETEITNNWDLQFGQQVMDLEVEVGAVDSQMNLGGIPLTNLTVTQGASSSRMTFESPNPEKMRRLVFRTGASRVDMVGLANAGFQEMILDSGAGSYNLDFSGKLQQAASVRITCGAGDFTIRVPNGTAAEVTVTSGLANITPTGTWTISGKTYTTLGNGPRLTISLEMGLGNLRLISQ